MAMVRQQTDDEMINGSTNEENAVLEVVENCKSRSSSRASSGSKRSTPLTMPSLQYSKDDLVKFSSTPLSKNWPSCLDPAYNNSTGKWDPERWFMNHRSDRLSSLDESTRNKRQDDCLVSSGSNKRKSSDPKERIKEEKDDIVLGPQRRSFGTGCHVTQQQQQQSSLARRPGSPLDREENFREPTRRIGSGRIMTRDRDQRDWDRDREYGYGRTTDRDRRDRFDPDDDKDLRRFTSNNRYNQRDRRSRTGSTHGRIDEMEPEWFSGGPTSQSETIELVGFEDPHDGDGKKTAKKKRKQNSRRSSLKLEDSEKIDVPTEEKSRQRKASGEQKQDEVKREASETKEPDDAKNMNDASKADTKFEVDELFKLDWMAGLPMNEAPVESTSDMGCSRFSQWFRRESPVPQGSGNNSRRSSLHDEMFANVLNSIVEPQIMIPSPTQPDNYFAPISPATHHSPGHPQAFANHNNNIMQMLTQSSRNSNINGTNPQDSARFVTKMETDLKRLVLGGDKPREEKSAFDKLLQHMSDTNAQAVPLSMGPLDKSKALQEQDLLQDMLNRPPPSSQPPPPPSNSGSAQQFQMFEQQKKQQQPLFQIPPGIPPPSNFPPSNPPPQNDAFAQLVQQQKHHEQQQHLQQMLQNQLPPPLSQQSPNPGANPPGPYTVDMLAKLLNPAGSTQPPLSPSGLPANFHGPMRNDSQQVINSVLQAQRQRELLSNLFKQQQQQFPVAAPTNMMPPQQVQSLRCASAKDGQLQQQTQLTLPALGLSPRQSPLPHEAVGTAIQNQGRIPSPLIFGQQPPALSHAPAPIHPAALIQAMSQQNSVSPNTLQVQNPVVLQRVPSPQELRVHTQTILHKALIKSKLEEQKENFRKRQEALRSTSPASINKNGASPSLLKESSPTIAFTPTSVMRKIQSDKNEVKEQKVGPVQQNGNKFPGVSDQSRVSDTTTPNISKPNSAAVIPTAMESHFGAQFPQNPPNSNISQAQRAVHGEQTANHSTSRPLFGTNSAGMPMAMQGPGRPIVKVGMNQPMNANEMGRVGMPPNKNVPHNKMMMPNSNNQTRAQNMSGLHQQLQMTAAYASINRPPLNHPNMIRSMNPAAGATANNMNFPPLIRNAVQNPIRTPNAALNHLNQLAALQQIQRGSLDSRQLQQLNHLNHQLAAAQQNQRLHPAALQQMLMNSQNSVTAAAHAQVGFPGGRVDSTHLHPGPQPGGQSRQSPVNLTKWFGSDVLQQKMPDMPPLPMQKALSLEEVERQQQVHN